MFVEQKGLKHFSSIMCNYLHNNSLVVYRFSNRTYYFCGNDGKMLFK